MVFPRDHFWGPCCFQFTNTGSYLNHPSSDFSDKLFNIVQMIVCFKSQTSTDILSGVVKLNQVWTRPLPLWWKAWRCRSARGVCGSVGWRAAARSRSSSEPHLRCWTPLDRPPHPPLPASSPRRCSPSSLCWGACTAGRPSTSGSGHNAEEERQDSTLNHSNITLFTYSLQPGISVDSVCTIWNSYSCLHGLEPNVDS